MAESNKNTPHLSVDGKWFPCNPAGEFGFLGDRINCDFVSTGGQPPKKLLCRKHQLSNDKKPNDEESALQIDTVPDAVALGLRPLAPKRYQYAIPSADRNLKREEHQFLQQDNPEDRLAKCGIFFIPRAKPLTAMANQSGASGYCLCSVPTALPLTLRRDRS